MAANALRVRERFAPEKTLDAWERVIAAAVEQRMRRTHGMTTQS